MGVESENEKTGFALMAEELRALRGSLNARGFGEDNPVLVEITTLKVQMHHLQSSVKELRAALWGIAAGVLALVIKMVVEGSLFK
jgi:hypothetical protein